MPDGAGELPARRLGHVRFKLQAGEPPLIIPSNAVILRNGGTFVAIVESAKKLHVIKVKLGRNFGLQVEITSDLDEGVKVVAVRIAGATPKIGAAEGTLASCDTQSGVAKTAFSWNKTDRIAGCNSDDLGP